MSAPVPGASRRRRGRGGNGAPAPRPGRDRKAEVLRPAPGRDRFAPADAPRFAVVGGGIAGLAAATLLAERGARVTLYERGRSLGGRLAGRRTRLADGSTATMTRGFHAFFRQYYNLRALLRRTDPALARLTPLPDYPLRHSNGLTDSFARVPRTPPFSALGFVARSPTFTWRGLAAMNARAALPLLDVRVPEVYDRFDTVSAASFLDGIRFPEAAHHLAFEVFSRSFFADPRELSAAEMLLMFHIYFLGSAEGLLFDVPDDPFPQALWEPLARHLLRLGVSVRTGSAVHGLHPHGDGRGMSVRTDGTAERHEAVVLALDPAGLRQVVAGSPRLGTPAWREDVAALRTAPPFLVSRLWLDRPVRADRPGFLGTSGYDGLDNISVLERYEGEAARWAARHGGSVVELHAYAVTDAGPEGMGHRLVERLHRVYPETRGARIVDARHEWRSDCPLFAVGSHHRRPTVRTPQPGLTLAGDAIRCDLPVALMERAATTGFLAANALLADRGVRGQTLWTVPRAGRSPVLRALGALAAR